MNLTNNYDNETNSSSDDDDDNNNNHHRHLPSIYIENFLSNHNTNNNGEDDDDDADIDSSDNDDDESDIENQYNSKSSLPTSTRLSSLLRQSHCLVELKLNTFTNNLLLNSTLRHALSDSDMSKHSHHYQIHRQQQDNQPIHSLQPTRTHRLYLPSTYVYDLQTHITNWLQSSACLIDSLSTLTYHRRCWSQLLLTYFIEEGYINFEFLRCMHSSSSLTTVDQDLSSIHKHACVPEEDAFKLCSILQKGSRLNINSNIFDHIRRIIVIKSIQEVNSENNNLQEIYVKQLQSLKQSLTNLKSNNSLINIASIYSKLLLFLSSLYSIKAETMQILFCQHLLQNPTYSYLLTS